MPGHHCRGAAEAVLWRCWAVAPGVWAPMTPGATPDDVATAGVLDGFCPSIEAYERKFTPGEEHGGTCW